MVVVGSDGLYFGTFRLLLQTTFSGPFQSQRIKEGRGGEFRHDGDDAEVIEGDEWWEN